MRKTVRTILATLGVTLLVAIAWFLLVIYGGTYNVAATADHWGITRWALSTLQHRSVAARAADVTGRPPTDSASLAEGFEHFHAMCVQCHAAPGRDRGEVGQGMRPTPPRLEEEAHEWSDAELFWITRNGIRLAGMPAFGPTHDDETLWAIVAFLRRLERMTEEEYGELVQATASSDTAGHSHAAGTPAHEH